MGSSKVDVAIISRSVALSWRSRRFFTNVSPLDYLSSSSTDSGRSHALGGTNVAAVSRFRTPPLLCVLPIVVLGVLAAGSDRVGAIPLGRQSLALVQVARGLPGAVFVAPAPSRLPGRLYVVQKTGTIVIVDHGRALPTPFLDIRGQVAGGELRGLFSVAFHPDFRHNGELFVNYVGRDGDIYVTRFRAVHGLAALSSRRVLLRVPTSTTDPDGHYGGQLAFGPDGRLYVGFGDGNNPESAQDPSTLLGKLVRLDVDTPGRGAADRRVRPAQPVADLVRPAHGRPLHRRRR